MNARTSLGTPALAMTAARRRWLRLEVRKRLATGAGRPYHSDRTQAHCADCIVLTYSDLWTLGFHIERVESLAPRHLLAVVEHWREKGLARSTVAVRWSYLGAWCRVIGKNGILPSLTEVWPPEPTSCLEEPTNVTLVGLSADAYQRVLRILGQRHDLSVYWMARCVRELQLTREEALLLEPERAVAHDCKYLVVWSGKSRDQRVVRLVTPEQAALARQLAKWVADIGRSRVGWRTLSVVEGLRRYSNALAYAMKKLAKGDAHAD
jgi:hypothetical protein